MESLARAANRGSISTTFDVENSCRFNWDATSGGAQENGSGHSYMTDTTWTGTPTSTTTGCFSTWFKPSLSNSTNEYNVASFANNHADSSNRCYLMGDWGSGGNFIFAQKVSASWNFKLVTNALYRDPSAWYHFFAIWDTSNATEGERIRMYVNGERITSFAGEDYPSQNQTVLLVDEEIFSIGRAFSSVYGSYTHGYMAETALIDGTAYAVSEFGENDEDSGIWKPKDISGLTFGTKGLYLDYKDSSNLGNDVSGNNRDLALTSIDATNQTTDTPTNSFATLNPLDGDASTRDDAPFYLDDGNLTATADNSGYNKIRATMAVGAGKWYWEVKCIDNGSHATHFVTGVVDADWSHGDTLNSFGYPTVANNRQDENAWTFATEPSIYHGYDSDGSTISEHILPSGNWPGARAALVKYTADDGDIYGFALDMDNGKMWIHRNGNWYYTSSGTADPANGSYPLVDTIKSDGIDFAMVGHGWYGTSERIYSVNFGNPAFSISSGNADGNGYGNFEYAPPSGFYAWCTKNLAEYG